MHELSLALNVVALADEAVKRANAQKAVAITMEIGECAGIEQEAFEFAWPLAVKDSVLEGAEKMVIEVSGRAQCQHCSEDFAIHRLYDQCPKCGSFLCEIYQGKEFRIKSLKVV